MELEIMYRGCSQGSTLTGGVIGSAQPYHVHMGNTNYIRQYTYIYAHICVHMYMYAYTS